MTDKSQKKKTGPESFLTDWMKMTTELWQELSQVKSEPETSKPETMETLLKAAGMLPEIFLKIAKTGSEAFETFQEHWVEGSDKSQEITKIFQHENFKEDTFKAWSQMYDQEFRKFFKIPQLGLTRNYQEKMIRSMDKYNVYQAAVSDFSHLLLVPMEKSFKDLHKKLTELKDKGDLPEDSKKYYQMWIKVLEDHYMTLFQSSEYTLALHRTIDSMAQFSAAKNDILQDFLTMLPVTTHKEMDELYKEIYLLKKRIKKLEKKK